MKPASLVCVALAFLGLLGRTAAAAPLDITLSVPLVSVDSTTPTIADTTLSGTLTYDDATQLGSGLFTVGGYTDDFSGIALVDEVGSLLGVEFSGDNGDSSASLYFNFALSPDLATPGAWDASGSVSLSAPGQDEDYTTLTNAVISGLGSSVGSGATGLGMGVSPVPLPPAGTLFVGALLVLVAVGQGPRLAAAAVRRGW